MILLDDVQGDCLEIIAEFAPQSEGECGLILRCSPDGQEQSVLSISRKRVG